MKIELNRSDFKNHCDDNESYFDDLLSQLGIEKTKWKSIQSIELEIDSFDSFDENYKVVGN